MALFSKIAKFAEIALSADVYARGADFEVTRPAAVSSWTENSISFTKAVGPELAALATKLNHAALIVPNNGPVPDCSCIVVSNPRLVFAKIVAEFFANRAAPGIHETALVSPSAKVDETACIGPFCTVGDDVVIGARTVLHTHVTVTRNVTIGSNCVLWSHCVLGEDGFGIEKNEDGTLFRIPHIGGVRVGDRVHIGNFTSVVGGTIDPTVIEDGAMIDNLVHIAHNAHIGENSQIIACAEISGSVKVGRNAWVAPNAAVIQKVEIGENSIIGLGAAVTQSIPPNVIAAGVPAKVIREIKQAKSGE